MHSLGKMAMSKIHFMTGFSYSPNTVILTLPVELDSVEFLSLTHINADISVKGLWHNINHHIPAYHDIARLTLTNWTCGINHCVYPLDGI
jgi:hypothetical protein